MIFHIFQIYTTMTFTDNVKPWFDTRCGSASLYPCSSLPVALAQSDKRL